MEILRGATCRRRGIEIGGKQETVGGEMDLNWVELGPFSETNSKGLSISLLADFQVQKDCVRQSLGHEECCRCRLMTASIYTQFPDSY